MRVKKTKTKQNKKKNKTKQKKKTKKQVFTITDWQDRPCLTYA